MIKEVAVGTGVAVVAFMAYLGYNVVPLLFLAGLLVILAQTAGFRGLSGKLTSAAPRSPVRSPVDFDDIGGQETAKNELIEALDFITEGRRAAELGIRPLRGILLTGPPGTGKTLLARAAAGYTDSYFLYASGSEFVEVYAGVGAQRVRDLFGRARSGPKANGKQGSIIFIDELEVLGGQRGKHTSHLEYDQTLNQLLVEMDGLSGNDEVTILVIGATNRMDLLDQALLRPGRFDRIVRVDLPDREGRKEILELHTRNKPLAADVDIDRIARETFGFSGAHLESVTNEAAILAWREGGERIGQRHLAEAVDKVILGEKLPRRPSGDEMRRIAVHEAGHAAVAEHEHPGSVSTVTVTSRGSALGYVRQVPKDDLYVYTVEQLEAEIRLLLAGSVAEGTVLGGKSTGCAEDLQRAASMAKRLVFSGISPLGAVDPETLPGSRLNRAVQGVLKAQEERVTAYLRGIARFVEEVAETLLEAERMSGEEFRAGLASWLGRGEGSGEEAAAAGQADAD